jgi:hypothetical protein
MRSEKLLDASNLCGALVARDFCTTMQELTKLHGMGGDPNYRLCRRSQRAIKRSIRQRWRNDIKELLGHMSPEDVHLYVRDAIQNLHGFKKLPLVHGVS